MKKYFALVAILFVFVSSSSFAEERAPAAAPQAEPQHVRRTESEDDQRILANGRIENGNYITGGVVGSIVGFGIGHAIQGRYASRGWIFTAGDAASLILMVSSVHNCHDDYDSYGYRRTNCDGNAGLAAVGLIGFIGFHVWEVVDLWVAPPRINRRYDELTGRHRVTMQMSPVLLADSKATAPGLGLKLSF